MTKVHPNARESPSLALNNGEALTVWRKSLLLDGKGFTVFDAKGNLVFRVDNYSSANKDEIVLMDAAGKSLLTFRRKKLSLGEHWVVYEGDEASKPRFSVKKQARLLQPKTLARVLPCGPGGGHCSSYDVEGAYSKRCCMVYTGGKRKPVAEIRRKEPVAGVAFDADVFRLIVHPGFDASVAMAVVILLEQMFG